MLNRINIKYFHFLIFGKGCDGLGIIIIIGLIALGIALLFLEVFIPGFGIFGIGGAISIYVAIWMLAPTPLVALIIMILATVAMVAFFLIMVKNLPKNLVLETSMNKESGYSTAKENKDMISKLLLTKTELRPSGKAEFEGKEFEVITEGDFVEKAVQVEVIGNRSSMLLVKEIKAKTKAEEVKVEENKN